MKKIVWENDNQMKIETLHKTFNKQTKLISTGNVIASTMMGSYIRHWKDDGEGLVDYPRNRRANGVLFKYDMDKFMKYIDTETYKYILEVAMRSNKNVILYMIFHNNPDGIYTHGFILTDINNNLLKWFVYGNYKSQNVIETCASYLCN